MFHVLTPINALAMSTHSAHVGSRVVSGFFVSLPGPSSFYMLLIFSCFFWFNFFDMDIFSFNLHNSDQNMAAFFSNLFSCY